MKIAGLKGRSPETYPNHPVSGIVTTNSEVESDPVSLSPTPANLFGVAGSFPASPGDKVIVMYSGVVSESSGSVLVGVSIVLDNATTLYKMDIEVTGNGPTPFSLVYETPAPLAASPDPHAITLLASTDSGTATIAANGSVVVISTPS